MHRLIYIVLAQKTYKFGDMLLSWWAHTDSETRQCGVSVAVKTVLVMPEMSLWGRSRELGPLGAELLRGVFSLLEGVVLGFERKELEKWTGELWNELKFTEGDYREIVGKECHWYGSMYIITLPCWKGHVSVDASVNMHLQTHICGYASRRKTSKREESQGVPKVKLHDTMICYVFKPPLAPSK